MDFLTEQVNVGEIKVETKSDGKNLRLEVKSPISEMKPSSVQRFFLVLVVILRFGQQFPTKN